MAIHGSESDFLLWSSERVKKRERNTHECLICSLQHCGHFCTLRAADRPHSCEGRFQKSWTPQTRFESGWQYSPVLISRHLPSVSVKGNHEQLKVPERFSGKQMYKKVNCFLLLLSRLDTISHVGLKQVHFPEFSEWHCHWRNISIMIVGVAHPIPSAGSDQALISVTWVQYPGFFKITITIFSVIKQHKTNSMFSAIKSVS